MRNVIENSHPINLVISDFMTSEHYFTFFLSITEFKLESIYNSPLPAGLLQAGLIFQQGTFFNFRKIFRRTKRENEYLSVPLEVASSWVLHRLT